MKYSCETIIDRIARLPHASDDTESENILTSLIDRSITEYPACLTNISTIGMSSFAGCTNLATTSLPEGITRIENNAFRSCSNLALTSLPKELRHIGFCAFYECTNLAITSIPEGITWIDQFSFHGCTGLTTLTFKGTSVYIYATPFSGCTNLTTINVPWAEGAVSGAPWGATNATINYNYVEES